MKEQANEEPDLPRYPNWSPAMPCILLPLAILLQKHLPSQSSSFYHLVVQVLLCCLVLPSNIDTRFQKRRNTITFTERDLLPLSKIVFKLLIKFSMKFQTLGIVNEVTHNLGITYSISSNHIMAPCVPIPH